MTEGEAFVLQRRGLTGPEAAVTSVGFRAAKKVRKGKAPIPNIKRLRIFILVPMHFPVRAEGAHQLKSQLGFQGQADFRERFPLRVSAP